MIGFNINFVWGPGGPPSPPQELEGGARSAPNFFWYLNHHLIINFQIKLYYFTLQASYLQKVHKYYDDTNKISYCTIESLKVEGLYGSRYICSLGRK